MIREHPAVDGAPLERPGGGAVTQFEAADEDLVDTACERLREAVGDRRHEVRVPGDDGALRCERDHAVELLAVAVDVEVDDRHSREHDGVVAGHELDHLAEERPPPRRRGLAVKEVPSPHEHGHGVAYEAVRVLLADPPAFTPPYDHELAAALARAGVEVELVTSPFRFGDAPEPEGYRRRELFYPLSSRLFGRSRLRLPVKAAEHPLGLAALRRLQADVLHVQWLPAPELDAFL